MHMCKHRGTHVHSYSRLMVQICVHGERVRECGKTELETEAIEREGIYLEC